MNRYKPVGWRNEPNRHALSAKGVKTGTARLNIPNNTLEEHRKYWKEHQKDWDNAKQSSAKESFIVKVLPVNEDEWVGNELVFATKEEAEQYGSNLYSRWFGINKYKVEESVKKPNYKFVDDKLKAVDYAKKDLTLITKSQWSSLPKSYKSYIDGTPYVLFNNPDTGGTVLRPVRIVKGSSRYVKSVDYAKKKTLYRIFAKEKGQNLGSFYNILSTSEKSASSQLRKKTYKPNILSVTKIRKMR